jgi:hypothetical protein
MPRVSDRSVGRRLARAESKCTLPGGTHPSWGEYRDALHDLLDSRAECAAKDKEIERLKSEGGRTWNEMSDGEFEDFLQSLREARSIAAVRALAAKEE